MYREGGNALQCPDCQAALVVAGGTFPIHGCTACGGAWLGPEVAVRAMQGHLEDADREVVATAKTLARASTPPPRTGAMRACPQCSGPMAPFAFGEVELDSCPAHGTWFDHDELEKVTRGAHAARAEEQRRARGEDIPSLDDIADGVFTVAKGLVTLPLRLLWQGLNGYCEVCKQSGHAHLEGCPDYTRPGDRTWKIRVR